MGDGAALGAGSSLREPSVIRDETGQAMVLAVGLCVVALAVTGLTVDGARAMLRRRALQNAADGAALAAASELDRARYYTAGEVALAPAKARRTALRFLARRGVSTAMVQADEAGVVVTVRGAVRTSFLRLVGITRIPAAATARSEPVAGAPRG